jgi:hypothetical protein
MLSSGFAILSIAVLHIVLAISFIIIKTRDVESAEFNAKFGVLIEGQNVSSRIGRYWTVFSLVRQSTLSVTLVCLRDYPGMLIITLLVQSLIMQYLIVEGWPMKENSENWMNVFNEIMVSAYLYLSYALTGFNANPLYSKTGTALMGIIVSAAGVNFLKFLISLFKLVGSFCKKKCSKID